MLVALALPSGAIARTGAGSGGAGSVELAGTLLVARAVHSATLLTTGEILVAGGCTEQSCERGPESASTELFDPATGRSRFGPDLAGARLGHTATALADGRVLLAGGWGDRGILDTAELFDPESGGISGTLRLPSLRAGHSATLLPDGRVLLAGGSDDAGPTSTAALFDPATDTFSPTGAMIDPRDAHAAAPLADGRVLVVGGRRAEGDLLASAEVYDPATAGFRATGFMPAARQKLAAAPLADGRVLVVGGSDARDFAGRSRMAAIFDPVDGTFAPIGPMAEARFKFADAVVPLPTGVLVAGGSAVVEVFDPVAETFRPAIGDMKTPRMFGTTTVLPGGAAVMLGGYDGNIVPAADGWFWQPPA